MRDTTAFAISIVSLVIFCVPVLLGAGIAREWNVFLVTPNTFQFKTVENAARFWPEPNAYEENSEIDASIPGRDFDVAASLWYYWKLRPSSTDHCQEGEFDPVTEPYTLSCSVPQANAATRAFVWCCYLVHQCLVWGLIYKAQWLHKDDVKYHANLHWYNVASMIVNAAAYVLHLIQTHVTYDALAQDVTEASSQASVIVLLVLVLVMEYKHRGLFLGWPAWNDAATAGCPSCGSRSGGWSWRLPSRPIELVRKYHGYAFSWATIYTLWYHPMESTAAHVTGFLHTGMLLVQQGLIFTPMHLNKTWRLVLEMWVAVHGAVTAAQTQGRGMIGMFLFGFLWMAAFTQVHGLPYYLAFAHVEAEKKRASEAHANDGGQGEDGWSSEPAPGQQRTEPMERNSAVSVPGLVPAQMSLNRWAPLIPSSKWKRYALRLIPPVLYFIFVVASYQTWLNNPDQALGVQMTEITRIPLILYLMAVFVSIISWGMMSMTDVMCSKCCGGEKEERTGAKTRNVNCKDEEDGSGCEAAENVFRREERSSSNGVTNSPQRLGVGSIGPGTVLVVLFVGYAVMVVVSVAIEAVHVKMPLIMLMVVLVAIFSVLALVVMILMEKDMRRIDLGPPQLPVPAAQEDGKIIPSHIGSGSSSDFATNGTSALGNTDAAHEVVELERPQQLAAPEEN